MRKVWFELVNESGDSLARSYVEELPRDADIAAFQKALGREYGATLLAGVAIPNLVVFPNRDAFENATRPPLEIWEPIASYGASFDKSVVVQVPPATATKLSSSLEASASSQVETVLQTILEEIRQEQEKIRQEQEKLSQALTPLTQGQEEIRQEQEKIRQEQEKSSKSLEELKKRPRECVAFSSMTGGKRAKLLETLKLQVEVVNIREPQVAKAKRIPAFVWDTDHSEDDKDQVKKYKRYLSDHFEPIVARHGLCFLYVHKNNELLNAVDARLPFDLSGGADVVVLRYGLHAERNVHHLEGLRLVFELKKDVDEDYPKYESQTLAELVAVNLKAPDRSAVTVLTNLGSWWEFMWLSEDRRIRKLVLTEPANAARFIEALVSHNDLGVHLPFRCDRNGPTDLPMRGNINVVIPESDGDVVGEMVERYRSIASELGSDMTMEREIGWQVVRQMPAFSAMYS